MIVFGHKDFTGADALDNMIFFDGSDESVYLLMVAGDFYYHRVWAGFQHPGAEVFTGVEYFAPDIGRGRDFEEGCFSGNRVCLGQIEHLEHIRLLIQLVDHLGQLC